MKFIKYEIEGDSIKVTFTGNYRKDYLNNIIKDHLKLDPTKCELGVIQLGHTSGDKIIPGYFILYL